MQEYPKHMPSLNFLWFFCLIAGFVCNTMACASTHTDITLNTSGEYDLELRIRTPEGDPRPCPILVLSHGAMGSRTHMATIGNHFTTLGYLVIHTQHPGSDTGCLRNYSGSLGERLIAMIDDATNLQRRPQDISAALDACTIHEILMAWANLEHVIVAGHSFGAYTAMAMAGLQVDLDGAENTSFKDTRVDAVIALSPQGTGHMGISDDAWQMIDIPVCLLTGTKDHGAGKTDWTHRLQAYQGLQAEDALCPEVWLGVFNDATHMHMGLRRASTTQKELQLDIMTQFAAQYTQLPSEEGAEAPDSTIWRQNETIMQFDIFRREIE